MLPLCDGRAITSSTIAQAICRRSNRALGFVNQHRVHLLMKGLCRAANSCKPGLIVFALRVACNGLCTAARFHTVEENLGCTLKCSEDLDCLRHCNRCPTLFDHLLSLSLLHGTGECISPMPIFNDLLFKIAVRNDRLHILLSGLLDAFVTAFNLRKTHRGIDLNFFELMYGRNNMMTAQCPAGAHTYQSMCLHSSADELWPTAFQLLQAEKTLSLASYLPCHYQNDGD